ncbi:Wound-responsive family protein [Euphorbia peplus]|nr:Wound-responsive family protein [Euphorbia peplus]
MSSSAGKAWMVAASIGGVEALKDQLGFCRWNYVLRSAHQHAKTHLRSVSQATNLSSSSCFPTKNPILNQPEEDDSLRKVMFLTCWGPNN